ncbi:MAG TPA: hypothetical protein VGM90_25575 [Kofleriaceae bacterium]|jgi:hypothetical protein
MRPTYLLVILAAGCDLGPQVSDITIDGPPVMTLDAPPEVTTVLPAGTDVPSISANDELVSQIRLNDGLSDSALMMSNGVVARSTGKSGGATVRYWNFGPMPVETTIPVVAPLYVLGRLDTQSSVFTPLVDHLPLIDTICGDTRYTPLRRVIDVPVTAQYNGELITSTAALAEALDRGLVSDPVPDGTWVNMPVVLPGTTLEVGDPATFPPVPTKKVYARGYVADVFELGTSFGRQPLRNNQVPIGQASSLQSGVATGTPPALSTALDPQPVFQYTIPTSAPTTSPNYTPVATDVTVRLATNVAPTAITSDAQLFKRSASGSINAYLIDNVANFTINTTVNDLQIQFAEGVP